MGLRYDRAPGSVRAAADGDLPVHGHDHHATALAYSPPDHQDRRDRRSKLPKMTIPTLPGRCPPYSSPAAPFEGSSARLRGRYLEREAARKEPVDYERYLELKVGGVKGSSDEERVGLRERVGIPRSRAVHGPVRRRKLPNRLDPQPPRRRRRHSPRADRTDRPQGGFAGMRRWIPSSSKSGHGRNRQGPEGIGGHRTRQPEGGGSQEHQTTNRTEKESGRAEDTAELERSLEEAEQAVRRPRTSNRKSSGATSRCCFRFRATRRSRPARC